ncbi:MAG TPA: amidohydrolase family protein [Stellaceae bacterium]|nr:amidohydrolase family protein [Stellaceae bacterium]
MDANYLPFHPNPSKPRFRPPPGAVDAHCHVFGPEAKFPYAPERKYTPCDASKEKLIELRRFLGFARNVIVQASCHGSDNRALVDALETSNGEARGVAVVSPKISDGELAALDRAGVRGVRFNFLPRLVDATPHEVYLGIAERIKRMGWHTVVYFEAPSLDTITPFLKALPTTIVLDHMAVPDAKKGADHPDFRRFLALVAAMPNIWVKVTCPERISAQGPPYDDVVPFARALVEAFPDRVLWGTDWPHPNMVTHVPDDGQLVDMIPKFAPSAAQQKALLVDNPMRLYWAN